MAPSRSSSRQLRIPTRVGAIALSDHRLYDGVIGLLGEGWRVIRADGPGFRRCDPAPADGQPERYARAILEVLDALDIPRGRMCCCSWGGRIAAHVAVAAPHRIA